MKALSGVGDRLCFADDIDGLAGVAKLVERLDKASTAYGIEISAEKTKLMTNRGIDTEIKERTELFFKRNG